MKLTSEIAHDLWLEEARSEFQAMCGRIRDCKRCFLTTRIIWVLVLEPPLFDIFQRHLRSHCLKSVCLSVDFKSAASSSCPDLPSDSQVKSCATDIARLLSTLDGLNELSVLKAPATMVTIFMGACQNITELFLELDDTIRDGQGNELAQCFRRQKQLKKLYLSQLSTVAGKILFPSLSLLNNLSDLYIGGKRGDCLEISSQNEGVALRRILELPGLRMLRLERLALSSRDSVMSFCEGMRASKCTNLTMSTYTFPSSHCSDVGNALASSNLVKLCINTTIPRRLVDAFCQSLAASVSSVMEEFHFASVNGYGRCENPFGSLTLKGSTTRPGFHGYLDQVLIENVHFVLRMSHQRRISLPLLAAIDRTDTDEERRQCLVKALSSIDYPVAFEHLQGNVYNIIAHLQQLGQS